MTKQRLSPEDWIAAGFRALAQHGPKGLRAEAIARDLNTTKGSFYWHFKDLPAYRSAMLALWQEQATAQIIAALQHLSPGFARLQALVDRASDAPARYGGARAEPAIRDWARHDPEAATALARVDQARLEFLISEFAAMGVHDPAHARLFYAAHLGLELLCPATGQDGAAERHALLELLRALR